MIKQECLLWGNALNSLIDLFAFDYLVGSWAQACLYLNILLTVISIFFQS